MARFEEAFKLLPQEAQRQVQEIAAYAVLQSYLKDPATKPDMENVTLVSNALAIMYDGDESRIATDYQGVMNSRYAKDENSKTLRA